MVYTRNQSSNRGQVAQTISLAITRAKNNNDKVKAMIMVDNFLQEYGPGLKPYQYQALYAELCRLLREAQTEPKLCNNSYIVDMADRYLDN